MRALNISIIFFVAVCIDDHVHAYSIFQEYLHVYINAYINMKEYEEKKKF